MDGKSIEIGIFLLERNDDAAHGEWRRVVVAASNESQARQIANSEAGTEGYVWTDGTLVEARRIGSAGEGVHGVLMSSKE